jgi:DNA-binding beta-propeller fold protein YncE
MSPLVSFRPFRNGLAEILGIVGIVGIVGGVGAASAQPVSEPRARITLSPSAAQSAVAPLPSLVDSLRAAGHRPAITGDAAAASGDDVDATNGDAAPAAKTTLFYPYGITVNASGEIFVTNVFGGVNVYSATLKYTGAITAGVSFPAAVAVSSNGNVYVANNGGNNITIYNPALTQIGTISDATLTNPESMYIDADDTIWVLDAVGVLHPYLYNGTALPSTTTGGTVVGPGGPNVTVWGITDANGGYDELLQNRAEAMHYGALLSNGFRNTPLAGGETQDDFGLQYVTDTINNRVEILNPATPQQIVVIDTIAAPYGIAVDSVRKRLYVVLTSLNQVVVYSLTTGKQLAVIR